MDVHPVVLDRRPTPLTDTTTALNIGIIIGALLPQLRQDHLPSSARSSPAHCRRPHWRRSDGYGAAFAFGCNIGAYFSGDCVGKSARMGVGLVRAVGTVGLKQHGHCSAFSSKPEDLFVIRQPP